MIIMDGGVVHRTLMSGSTNHKFFNDKADMKGEWVGMGRKGMLTVKTCVRACVRAMIHAIVFEYGLVMTLPLPGSGWVVLTRLLAGGVNN